MGRGQGIAPELECARRLRRHVAPARTGIRLPAFCQGLKKGQALRVVRGGSWNNNPRNCRSANRNNDTPDNRNTNNGLRLLRAPDSRSRAAGTARVCAGSPDLFPRRRVRRPKKEPAGAGW
ncbi:MAG: SUMF1/EgtB/PvdO family nonheme iron enzyme [Candidatus Hydrogenedentes bacterium]|nr:SUMF1/EgtB/PvdO family nonheme iron enzyme [Candidatus Hydrogenedentota bacterium]